MLEPSIVRYQPHCRITPPLTDHPTVLYPLIPLHLILPPGTRPSPQLLVIQSIDASVGHPDTMHPSPILQLDSFLGRFAALTVRRLPTDVPSLPHLFLRSVQPLYAVTSFPDYRTIGLSQNHRRPPQRVRLHTP